jgi:hypothetical protein
MVVLYLGSHPDLSLTVLSLSVKISVSDEFTEGLEYKPPQPFLQTSGLSWSYQPAVNLYKTLKETLISSYEHYRGGSKDKIHHPLYLFLAGVGAGKSRHATEFSKSVVKCLSDDDAELKNKLNDAWVFHVSLENGTSLGGEEIQEPLKAIGTRMLLQLLPHLHLTDLVERFKPPHPLEILELIAKRHRCRLAETVVILVIDGLQNIFENTQFRSTVTGIGDLTALGPFIIPCCTATSSAEIQGAFSLSSRPRVYLGVEPLESPDIDGSAVFGNDPLTNILVRDCGGHGRALEILAEVLAKTNIEDCNLKMLMTDIQGRLLQLYQSAIKWTDREAQSLIVAVLTNQRLNANSPLPHTNKLPENFAATGLIRFVNDGSHGYLEAPYIWIWAIATRYRSPISNIWRFDDYNHLLGDLDSTRQLQVLTHQEFEKFNAFFRCMKSRCLPDGEVTRISTIHWGAELNGDIQFKNRHLSFEKAERQTNTKSTAKGMVPCMKRHVDVHESPFFILNAPNAPYGDAFCGLDTTGRNEVHQYRFYRKKIMNWESFIGERQKAASPEDFFLLITTSKIPDMQTPLPENSGIVHADNWKDYFGPFAGRMFLGPDDNTFDINSATRSLLQFVVTPEAANEIAKKRPFASIMDAAEKTQIPEHRLKRFRCENVS